MSRYKLPRSETRGDIITDPTDVVLFCFVNFAQFVSKSQTCNEKHFSVLSGDMESLQQETKSPYKQFRFVLQNAISCIFQVVLGKQSQITVISILREGAKLSVLF